LLDEYGPSLSSALVQRLASSGVSQINGRQIVARGGQGIFSLKGIKFPHNERFLYLGKDIKSARFWTALRRALEEKRTAYGAALASLEVEGNRLFEYRFAILSGSPNRLKGHLSYERILQRLLDVGLLVRTNHGKEQIITIAPQTEAIAISPQEFTARQVAENIVIGGVKDWARKLGITSYGSGKTWDGVTTPLFGQFAWDFTGPSYVHPFVSYTNAKTVPGFVVADVILGEELAERHVEFFVRKTDMLRRQRRLRPFMALLIADRFSPNALRRARQRGLVFATPSLLFGKALAAVLTELIQILKNAAAVAVTDPLKIHMLFSKLTTIEGAAANLRGPLFEMIAAHIVSGAGGWVRIGEIVTDPTSGETAEIDVMQTRSDTVLVVECKGRLATRTISLDEVQDWLGKKVPRLRNYLLYRYSNVPLRFEFWTTASFSSEATLFLERRKQDIQKYEIGWKDGEAVVDELRKINATRLVEVINEHYRYAAVSLSGVTPLD